jgi:hypothetical protein
VLGGGAAAPADPAEPTGAADPTATVVAFDPIAALPDCDR